MQGRFRDPHLLHVGGCGEPGQAAASPTNPVVQPVEMLPVLCTAGAAVGRMG